MKTTRAPAKKAGKAPAAALCAALLLLSGCAGTATPSEPSSSAAPVPTERQTATTTAPDVDEVDPAELLPYRGPGGSPFAEQEAETWTGDGEAYAMHRVRLTFDYPAVSKTVGLELYLPKGYRVKDKGDFDLSISDDMTKYLYDANDRCIGVVTAEPYKVIGGKEDASPDHPLAAYMTFRVRNYGGLLDLFDYLPIVGRHPGKGRGHNAISTIWDENAHTDKPPHTHMALLTYDPALMMCGIVELLPDALPVPQMIRLTQSLMTFDPADKAVDPASGEENAFLRDYTCKNYFPEDGGDVWPGDDWADEPEPTLYRVRTALPQNGKKAELELYLPKGYTVKKSGSYQSSFAEKAAGYLYDANGRCVGAITAGSCSTADPAAVYGKLYSQSDYLPMKGRRADAGHGHNALSRSSTTASLLMTCDPALGLYAVVELQADAQDALTQFRVAQSLMLRG